MPISNQKLSKIEARYWRIIKSRWFSYFPIIDPPGSSPGSQISELNYLVEFYDKAKKASDGTFSLDHPSLRGDIFREGIFLLHKANNICCASLNQIENGILTWSVSSIYQSSFFAMKAILCFLGISIPQMGMHHLIIDAFPEDEKLSSKERKNNVQPKPLIKFIYTGCTLTHKDHWQILQRTLRKSEVEVWTEEEVNYLKNFPVDNFTKDRNDLHYKSYVWHESNDLFGKHFLDDYAVNEFFLPKLEFTPNYIDGSHYINYILIKLALKLVANLAENASVVNLEYNLMMLRFSDSDSVRFKKTVNMD